MTIIVFLVAGISSRFGKLKQIARVGPNNETLIEYSVKQAMESNFSKIIFVTNRDTEYQFRSIFGNMYKNVPIIYIEQQYDRTVRTRPWGTIDAVCSTFEFIDEPIIVVNGDDIYGTETFKKGFELLHNTNKNIIGGVKMIKTMPENGAVNRGIIETSDNIVTEIYELMNISKQNNPELMTKIANVNFIGLQIDIIKRLKILLDDFKNKNINNPKIECILTDELNQLIKNKEIPLKLEFFEIQNEIIGLTNPDDEQIVKNKLKNLIGN